MGCEALSLDTIAVAMADEGVPLRAIARVTKISSEILRERLRAAKDIGSLVELPRDDWPPGFPRDQRALQLSRLAARSRPELSATMQRVFGLPPTEVLLFPGLLQHDYLNKNCVSGMAAKTVDVHICQLRARLKPHRIAIETIWGTGYRLEAAGRRRAMDLILQATGDGAAGRSRDARRRRRPVP
jgi:hypothetical protein